MPVFMVELKLRAQNATQPLVETGRSAGSGVWELTNQSRLGIQEGKP